KSSFRALHLADSRPQLPAGLNVPNALAEFPQTCDKQLVCPYSSIVPHRSSRPSLVSLAIPPSSASTSAIRAANAFLRQIRKHESHRQHQGPHGPAHPAKGL